MNALRTLYEAEKSRTITSAGESVKTLINANIEEAIPEEIYDPHEDSRKGRNKTAKNNTYRIPEETTE
jgi:hypothetical protein